MINLYWKRLKKLYLFLGSEVWWMFVSAIGVGFLWFLVESFFLVVLQSLLYALDLVDESKSPLYRFLPQTILGASLLFALYGLFRCCVSVMREYFAGVTSQVFIRSQRERIVQYSLHNAKDLISYEVTGLMTETVNKAGLVVTQMTQFTNLLTSGLLLFILGCKLAPIELFVGLCLLSGLFLPLNYFTRKIADNYDELNVHWNRMLKILHLGFKNYFYLSLYQLVDQEVDHAASSLRRYERSFKNYYLVSGLKTNLPIFAGVLILSLIMYISKKYIGTSGSVLIAFFYLFIRLSQTASEGNTAISNFKFNWAAFKTLYDWNIKSSEYFLKHKSNKIANEVALDGNEIKLQMKNVDFGYLSKLIFKSFNLHVKTGEILLIRGESGAGKSTLLSLLLGLEKPLSGEVTLNGLELQEVKNSLAKITGYVGADPYLIPGTVRENLTYGLYVPVSDDDIYQALHEASIYDEVMRLPYKLEEELKETTQLSTGQKQRLGIARAFLRKPSLLVWDEATANLDDLSEQKCIQNLLKKLEHLAVIVVSHKNSFDAIANSRIQL